MTMTYWVVGTQWPPSICLLHPLGEDRLAAHIYSPTILLLILFGCESDDKCLCNALGVKQVTNSPGHGLACRECVPNYYGVNCSLCPVCPNNGYCIEGMKGSGKCTICPAGLIENPDGTCAESICPTGFWGIGCSRQCSCRNGLCDPDTGYCRCPAGWMGAICHMPCDGTRFGPVCSSVCACKNDGVCDRFTGICSCRAGWKGKFCNETCATGTYGAGCSSSCNCKNGATCDRFSGCVCWSGFTGTSCERPCADNIWGPNCIFQCYRGGTSESRVSADSGCSCAYGYTWSDCANKCPSDSYGPGCPKCDTPSQTACVNATICMSGWTGNSCTTPCDVTQYGKNCGSVCLCKNGGWCDRYSGECACSAGWTGSTCETPCPSGRYGLACKSSCDCVNGAMCDRFTGECICAAGWKGPMCSIPCERGSYGPSCTGVCNCTGGNTVACDRFAGCKCLAGWTGVNCELPCAAGRWDADCLRTCNCAAANATCDRFKGCKCPPGLTGIDCKTKCAASAFGPGCASACDCRNGATMCDSITGACECTNGWMGRNCAQPCPSGFTGRNCSTPCASGDFGSNCTSKCACNNGALCDKSLGCNCTAGWTGSSCNETCAVNRFGVNCAGVCDCRNNATCDRLFGCLCPPGWIGSTCQEPCPRGRFGAGCSGLCGCANDADCNATTGQCRCGPGWTGVTCGDPCSAGKYGQGCAAVCACVHGACSPLNGACVCEPGWRGIICDEICPNGTYGAYCVSNCTCKNEATCSPMGYCNCTKFWDGRNCDEPRRLLRPSGSGVVQSTTTGIRVRLYTEAQDAGWHYKIERVGCPIVPPVWQNNTDFLEDSNSLEPGQKYVYSITPFNPVAISITPEPFLLQSEPVQRTHPPNPPKITSIFTSIEGNAPAITITWTDDNVGLPIDKTLIIRSDGMARNVTADTNGTFVDSDDVVPGVSYSYTLASWNAIGKSNTSLPSKEVAVRVSTSVVGASSSSQTSAGAIAGAVVATIVGASASLGFMFWYRRRANRLKMEALIRSELELIDTVVQRPEIADLEIPIQCIRMRKNIGEGEFGEVYRAEVEVKGGQPTIAAVKTFKVTSLASADAVRSARSAFLGEIDLLRTVPKHRHVIELLGVCTQGDPNCMVMEYAEHGDARHYVQQYGKELSAVDLLCFCIDIARGMEHLANSQIIHRDLAARNCMVVAGPRPPNPQEKAWTLGSKAQVLVKIADFGLSRDSGDYYHAKTDRKLPIKWLSIESLEKRIFTHASDVWSYGVTAWEIFSKGIKPYPGIENRDIAAYLAQGRRMSAPEGCPVAVHAAMEACWRKHPETRPNFAQVVITMRRAMQALCSGVGGMMDLNIAGDNAMLDASGQEVFRCFRGWSTIQHVVRGDNAQSYV
eukprot:Opistho-2@93286